MIINNFLSVWEIAHRWQNVDPNKTDPENLPFIVQDSLRFLCRLLLQGKIGLYDEIFINSNNVQHKHKSFVAETQLPGELELAVTERKYDSKVLDGCLIDRIELFGNSIREEWNFPDFWFDDELAKFFGGIPISEDRSGVRVQTELQKTRESFIDKTVCQAIAKTLWDIYPKIRIAEMTMHPSILNYGGGKKYKGKNTLPDWLREVAPEHIKNKRGRSKNSSISNSAL